MNILRAKRNIHAIWPPATPVLIETAKRDVIDAGAIASGSTMAICDNP